ncbi:MAG: C40 family peptidase [Gemmatimonadales bacterium]
MRGAWALALAAWAAPLGAQQGVFVTAGRVLPGQNEASWRITFQRNIAGPLGADIAFQNLPGSRPATGDLYGIGGDLTLFADARRIPTVFVGAAAGFGVQEQDRLWYAGSVGLRMPLVVTGPVRVMVEGRWRHLTVDGRDGIEVGVALGYRKPTPPAADARRESAGLWIPGATTDRLRAAGIPDSKARLLGNVVATALEEMGQPYLWGGTGNGSGGFDCSGLIQYAYSRHGVRLPRTSAAQAVAGVAIRRDLDGLLPGDILTFADPGGSVTHVGLYVGEGRFIHSASKGVRVSRLAEDDNDGRWWLRRWVGVRRVVE